VSAEGIAVKFGPFGEFVLDYEPFRTLESWGPYKRCEGEPHTTTEGFFRGTLRFRGEHDYFHVEASRAKGTLVFNPEWSCDYRRAGTSREHRPEVDDDKATLVASVRRESSSRQKSITQLAVFGSREAGEKPFTAFWAVSAEVRGGVGISRSTLAGTRSDGFWFDYRAGTARVDPPSPFAGSARYLRRLHAPDSWSGDLTAPFLGLGRVRLAGPGFRAAMAPELPNFR